MRLVHLSDLHLGYRQYQRLTPTGINQREADVAATFRTAVDRVIALRPDLVVVAGDVFHTVRPTNQAILHAFIQFARLTRALPDAVVVLVAGNHDTPRTSESAGILQLFAQLGISIVDREAQRLSFPEKQLSILAVPDVPNLERPSFTPDADAKYNVMVLHGEVEGMLPAHFANTDRAAIEISREQLGAQRWDYVALGHYHVYREIAPNAYYCGSIDYTSANTWGELHEERIADVPGKGFIERDLANGNHVFHALPASRPLIDLPPISAKGLAPADLDERIRVAVEGCGGGIDNRIVRLVVRDVPRHVARELDHKAIRDYKRRALNFQLDVRRPEAHRPESASSAPGRPRMLDIKDIVADKLRTRPLDAEIDRDQLIARAIGYIDEAQRAASAASPSVLVES